jgi:hypothetical protein
MGLLRRAFRPILYLVAVLDGLLLVRLFVNGWPRQVVLSDAGEGAAKVQVESLRFTATDWLLVATLVGIHAWLAYAYWHGRRRAP